MKLAFHRSPLSTTQVLGPAHSTLAAPTSPAVPSTSKPAETSAQAGALFAIFLPQERSLSPLLSINRAISNSPSHRQPSYLQSVARFWTSLKMLTPMFPVSSALFVRSLVPERKLTHLLSCACALFCEKVGVARNSGRILTVNFIDYQQSVRNTRPAGALLDLRWKPGTYLPPLFHHLRERLTPLTAISSM
jgi:hypothetical protein